MATRAGLCSCTLLVALGMVGCGGDGGDAGETRQVQGLDGCTVKQEGYYYLATVLPLTGSLGSFGPSIEQGVVQAVEEINEAGGIHGRSIGWIQCDSATDPTVAAARMQELADAEPLAAVIGAAASSSTIAAMDHAVESKKVLISPSATSAEITGLVDDGYLFRTCVSDAFQGVVAAMRADQEGYNRVFVINRNDSYGNGLREVFTANFTGAGKVVDYVTYDEDTPGYDRTVVDAAVAFGPDAVFLVAYVDDGASILKTAMGDGFTPFWILTDGVKNTDLLDKVGNSAYLEGILGTSPASPAGVDFAKFSIRYEELWGAEPLVFNANAYDAAYLLAIAMALAGNPDDGTQLRDQLANTYAGDEVHPQEWNKALGFLADGQMDYEGASGPVDFDENGDVFSNIEEWTFVSGQIVTLGCWTPEGQPCN